MPSVVTLYVLFACWAPPDFPSRMTRCGRLLMLLVRASVMFGMLWPRGFSFPFNRRDGHEEWGLIQLDPVGRHQRLVLVGLRVRRGEQLTEMLECRSLFGDLLFGELVDHVLGASASAAVAGQVRHRDTESLGRPPEHSSLYLRV